MVYIPFPKQLLNQSSIITTYVPEKDCWGPPRPSPGVVGVDGGDDRGAGDLHDHGVDPHSVAHTRLSKKNNTI